MICSLRSVLVVLALAISLPAAAEERLLAVLEFKSKLQGPEAKTVDATYLADVVRSAALEAAPGLRVMTRENMLVLVQASGKSLADCEGECEVDTGRKLGADLVISGELLKFGTKYKLDLRMHDTREGRLLSGAQASGKTVDELDDATGAAVKKLLAALQKATPAPAPVVAAAPAPAPTPVLAPPAAPASAIRSAPPPIPTAATPAIESQLVEQALSSPLSDSTAQSVQKQCREDAKNCFSLANGYSNGSFGLEQSGPIGLALFQHGCDAGDVNGCVMAINIVHGGTNVKKDPERARKQARETCGRGSGQACFLLEQFGTDDDKAFAHEQLGGQCLAADPDSCHYALSGDFKSARAQTYLAEMQRLCDAKKGASCFYLKTYREQGSIP